MKAKLVVVAGAAKLSEFKLKLPTIIGRSRTVSLPIGHPLVSRQHCELFEEDEVLKIRDLGSLNGTFVDETRIVEDTVLPPGALFTVGPLTFKAVYGVMPAVAAAPAADDSLSSVNFDLPPKANPGKNGQTVDAKPAAQVPQEAAAAGDDPEMDDLNDSLSAGGEDSPAGDEDEDQFDWLGEAPEETDPPAKEAAAAKPVDPADLETEDLDFSVAEPASDTTFDTTVSLEAGADTPPTPAAGKAPAGKKSSPKAPAAKPVAAKAAKAAAAKPAAAKPAAPASAPAAAGESDENEFAPPPRQQHGHAHDDGGDPFDFLQ